MALLRFTNSNDGTAHIVEDTSIAAELMRSDDRFVMMNGRPNDLPQARAEPPAAEVAITNKEFAGAKTIRELMEIQKRRTWKALGYKSFGAYLDSPAVPYFGKSKFYELKDQLLAEGDDHFDRGYLV